MNAKTEQNGFDCLSDQILRDFNSGLIEDPALEERVAGHLSSCDACDKRLTAVPTDTLVALLRAPDPLAPLIESGQLPTDQSVVSTKSFLLGGAEQSDTATGHAIAPLADNLPLKIDHYFVIRELGRGGFAQVYLARDPEHQRLVAIKVPRADRLATQASRAAFVKEARTIAVLDHPNIVPLYDCRELADGRCIVVMKYIEGRTLREAMATERFSYRESAELIAKIADALHEAHKRGIWHRDVKPTNILLDQDGEPYLTDFGLALHEDQQHLLTDQLAGTLPYMSPEQISGRVNHIDGRSDIWSLGIVLYELLTRKRPFSGASVDQLQGQIKERSPRSVSAINPHIPARLQAFCERCLQKRPEQRYETAAALAADLRAVQHKSVGWRTILAVAAGIAVLSLGLASVLMPQNGETSPEIVGPTQSLEMGPPNIANPHRTDSEVSSLVVTHAVLDRPLKRVVFEAVNNNRYLLDQKRQELFVKHDPGSGRALLAFDTPGTSDFTLRFKASLERGGVGCFWALHEDANAFPNKTTRCLAVMLFRIEGVDKQEDLRVRVDELQLEPSPFDYTRLRMVKSKEIARAMYKYKPQAGVPETQLDLQVRVLDGKVENLIVNKAPIKLEWQVLPPGWRSQVPAECGILVFDGSATISDATLLIKEHPNGKRDRIQSDF